MGSPRAEELASLLVQTASLLAGDVHLTPRVSPATLRTALARFDFVRPEPEIIAALGALLRDHTLHARHPRHLGLFHPPVDPIAVAATALVAGVDAQLAVWGAAPAAVEMERHVLTWVGARFGLPTTHRGSFTTGASESLHGAMVRALARAIPDYTRDGLFGQTARPMVYASREAHASFEKSLRRSGLGDASGRRVRCDNAWRMDLRALREAIAEDRAKGLRPLMVIATAGTTNTGAIDPLHALAELCAREDLWLHVDAAWAGAAALSPRSAHLLDGIGRADSVAWDAHKWLPLPIASGVLLTREATESPFSVDAPYLPRGDGDRAMPYRETERWSRPFVGASLFALLAREGADGVARIIDDGCARGDALRTAVSDAGWELIAPVPLPLVCFAHVRVRRGEIAPQKVAAALRRDGVAWLSETWIDGRIPALHASAMHPGLNEDDLAALRDALQRLG